MIDKNITQKLKEAGTNSRKIGREKDFKALHWVYRWGWSSASLIDHVASPGRRGLAQRLVKRGLLEESINPAIAVEKAMPRRIMTLTDLGQMLVENDIEVDELLDQDRTNEIPWHQLLHDAAVQRATAFNKNLLGFRTPKEIATKSSKGIKQPDAIWIIGNNLKMGVEVEINKKKIGRELDNSMKSICMAVTEKTESQLDLISIFSPSDSILNFYKILLQPGKKINRWKRNSARQWIVDEGNAYTVPESIKGKILFKKIEL